MYLYRSERDNRRGLPRSFSLSLSLCLCSRPLSPPHFNSHPSSQTFWLSVHVPCVWGQKNIPHTAFCLAGWNIPRSIWTKYNTKFMRSAVAHCRYCCRPLVTWLIISYYDTCKVHCKSLKRLGSVTKPLLLALLFPSGIYNHIFGMFLPIWSCRKSGRNHICSVASSALHSIKNQLRLIKHTFSLSNNSGMLSLQILLIVLFFLFNKCCVEKTRFVLLYISAVHMQKEPTGV